MVFNPLDAVGDIITKILEFVEENWLLIVIVLGTVIFLCFMLFIKAIILGK